MNHISVAIITHNRAKSLKDCLDSLHNQTVKPAEIIIVDNASTDDTRAVTTQFKKVLPIRYHYSAVRGYSINRVIALNKAKNNIIAWIDDDCVAMPNWIEETVKCSKIGRYCFQGVDIDENLNIFSQAQNLRTKEFRMFSANLLKRNVLVVSAQKAKQIYGVNTRITFQAINSVDHRSFVYRKDILRQLPYLFDTNLPPYFSADEWDILRRLRGAGHTVYLNPRLRVIHKGRASFLSFVTRQIQYGKNDAIREWIDQERRKKIYRLSHFFITQDLRRYTRTGWLFLQTDATLIIQILRSDQPLFNKLAIPLLFIIGKILRYMGRIHEQLTNKDLTTPYHTPLTHAVQ